MIDTLAFWAGLEVEQEKDAGATAAAMELLLAAARDGLAVLVLHHLRKAEGGQGLGVRGSSAIAGAVDAVVESAASTRRRRTGAGSWR